MSEFDINKNPETYSDILDDGLVNPFEEHQKNIDQYLDESNDENPKPSKNEESLLEKFMRWFGLGLIRN